VDPWFVAQLHELALLQGHLRGKGLHDIDDALLRIAKSAGFSDRRLSFLTGASEQDVRERRHSINLRPIYKRVDTCAAEFAAHTAYMYSSYDEEDEAASQQGKRKIMILGSGPNRIGQGIEFDY